jgi:hypothetical protein
MHWTCALLDLCIISLETIYILLLDHQWSSFTLLTYLQHTVLLSCIDSQKYSSNMSDPQSFIVSVVYKGSTKPLSLPPIREGIGHHSMQDLAEVIAAVFEIAPEQQRVIYKGKKIDIAEYDNDDAIPFPSGSKVCRKLQF